MNGSATWPTTTVRSIAKKILILYVMAVAAAQHSVARPGPQLQQGAAKSLTYVLFERFFFAAWLGEPMALRYTIKCDDQQILNAMANKQAFPDAFVRKPLGRHVGANYCAPVRLFWLRDELPKFSIRAPKVDACDDYRTRWNAVINSRDLYAAASRYAVSSATFEKYHIPVDDRSLHAMDWPKPQFVIGSRLIAGFRIVDVQEDGAFCSVSFAVDK